VGVGYVAGAGPVGEGHGGCGLVERVIGECGVGGREEVVLLFRERKLEGKVGRRMRVRERCRGICCIVSTYGRCIGYDMSAVYGHWLEIVFLMVDRPIKRLRGIMNILM
jgi:hypothetical protein